MKAKTYFAAFFVFMFTFFLVAQDTNSVPDPTDPSTGSGLLFGLIPVIVPILIAIGKYLAPKVPTILLPVVAPILGILIGLIDNQISGGQASPLLAAALGAAGVGLREIVDQVKQKILPNPIIT